MNKIVLSSILLMITNIVIKANNITKAFEKLTVDGYARAAYEMHHIENNKTYKDGAIGGKLHIQTASFYNLSLGASFYSSNAFGNSDNRGLVPFRGEVANGYALLGEAYVKAEFANTTFKIGRQEIDTPFADKDDIGLVPNTFEAYVIENRDIENTTLFFGQIQKMAGVDAEVIDSFTRVNGSNNMQVVGITNNGMENMELSLWYYHMQGAEVNSIVYTDVHYEGSMNSFGYEVALQYAKQTYNQAEDSSIYGVSTSLQYTPSGLTLAFAYNKAYGSAAFSGFGGGPFFSNSEYLIIDNAGKNGTQTWIGTEFDASVVGVDGLTLSLGYATLKDASNVKATELDFVTSYEIDDDIEIHLIASHIKGATLGEDDAKHLRVFANYYF